MILAALANGTSTITGALASDDTRVMTEALAALGYHIEVNANGDTITIDGLGGSIPATTATLNLANSGTSIRFLAALCSLGTGRYYLDGTDRMRQRPQGPLLQGLQQLGVNAFAEVGTGCPPIVIEGTGWKNGDCLLDARASSQFISALLMAAPAAGREVTIRTTEEFRPLYVSITTDMMTQWGVKVDTANGGTWSIPNGQHYSAMPGYHVEPDASAASYFVAAAALTGGTVTISGLTKAAMQGDIRFATEVLPRMGCTTEETAEGIRVTGPPRGLLQGIDVDMSLISDTSLTLAAIAPFAQGPTRIRGVAHSRLQECDRISAAVTEVRKLGAKAEEYDDGWQIWPAESPHGAEIETYNDHRVAMSFALAGLMLPGIMILNPGCVGKTFPGYWQALEALYLR
jgi:3-phosphoshikimate 1-carboxyvinyltransferase